jgi:eukaryotic-like serine/threonine-protein kinase
MHGRMTAEAQSTQALPLPRIVGRKTLLKLLARGGMGDVFLASTMGLEGAERPCVVKTVRRDHIHDGSFLARFLDEARVQAQLNDPGVAQVLEAGADEHGEPYTVVEYVEGKSLAEVRRRAQQLGITIGWAEAVACTLEMAQALAHVHERHSSDGSALGIVHRDLSPQNVMVAFAGDIKLIDFGTARGQNRRCHTVAGVVFAKPGYVAPEIARHEVGDGRIDLYALGVMLWELCRGQRLLSGDPQKHLEDLARNKVKIPKIALALNAPPDLDVILARVLANDPEERYPSSRAFAQDLARLMSHAPPSKMGERSIRGRIATLMQSLFPGEPARSRAEFADLMEHARGLVSSETPPASNVAEAAAKQCADPNVLAGTPYRLGKKIGDGASGSVYEAEHTELGRKVALKILDAVHSSGLESVDRFRREARSLANLRHKNLAYLHDFGKAIDGRIFLAMELLEGETLAEHLAKRSLALDPPSAKEAVEMAICICNALEVAHNAKLIHRDIKPENLYITNDGTLKLIDFGIALTVGSRTPAASKAVLAQLAAEGMTDHLSEGDVDVEISEASLAKKEATKGRLKDKENPSKENQGGFAIFGTPDYMAPEQVEGVSVDVRCDIYALGTVLFEICSGKRPFSGSPVEVMGKKLKEAPMRPRMVNTKIPARLEAVILKCIAREPEQRYGSAVELRDALERSLSPRSFGLKKTHAMALGAMVTAAFLGLGIRKSYTDTSPAVATRDATPAPATPAATVNHLSIERAAPATKPAKNAQNATQNESAESAMQVRPLLGAPEAPVPSASTKSTSLLTASLLGGPHRVSEPSTGPTGEAPVEPKVEAKVEAKAEPKSEPEAPALEHVSTAKAKPESLQVARSRAEESPKSPKALRAWARAASREGKLEEASVATERWLAVDGSAEPRVLMAQLLVRRGKQAEAKSLLELYAKNHPNAKDVNRELARMNGDEPAVAKHPSKGSFIPASTKSGKHQK